MTTKLSNHPRLWIAATCLLAAAGALALTWRSNSTAPTTPASTAAPTVYGQAQSRFPDDLKGWATFGDQLSIVLVSSERALTASAEEEKVGEGYVPRAVTVKVERTVWRRDGAAAEAPAEITYLSPGWVLHDHARYPFAFLGGARPETGGRYLVVLTNSKDVGWTPMAVNATMPIDDAGRVADTSESRSQDDPAEAMVGRTPEQVAAILADTKPSDAISGLESTSPEQRLDAVVAAMPHDDAADAQAAG
jgi:hypothetical protein